MYKKLFLCVAFLISARLYGQNTVDVAYFTGLFQQGKYVQAFNEAYALRKQPYNKQFILDYIMAKALCGTKQYAYSQRVFTYITDNYTLNSSQYNFIKDEEYACEGLGSNPQHATDANVIAKFTFIMNMPRNVSFVRGKGGLETKCKDDMAGFQLDPNFDQGTLAKRLFNPEQAAAAQAYYQQLLGDSYSVFSEGRFLMISKTTGDLSQESAANIAGNLNRELQFFHDQFGLSMPGKLIAVFLANDKPELDQLAFQLHGLTIPNSNLGYSSFSDMTLLAIADERYTGTLFHELFHLASREDMGDIPSWLDEGVASLYETSYWKDGLLYGDIKNWRTPVLKDFLTDGRKNVDLNELTSGSGNRFEVNQIGSACYLAFYYAEAKHFAIFLQERKLLPAVINAFRTRTSYLTDSNAKDESSQDLLVKATGMSMLQLQAEFDFWLALSYKLPEALSTKDIKLILARQATAIELLKGSHTQAYEELSAENNRLSGEADSINAAQEIYKDLGKLEDKIAKAQTAK